MKRTALMLASLSLFILVLTGCGGGGGGTTVRQQKTATITFSTVSSAHKAPLQGIQVTTKLPAGASVSNINSALRGLNDTGLLAQSVYNPPAVSFIVQSNGTAPIKFGPFAELTCDIATGFTLDQSSFSILSGDLQMTGKDANGTTIDLVPQLGPVKLSVTFGF
ncbi:MAG TPA: hypothetical protein VN642_00220 [Dongiaceae bacterium]|nr:hypothetical protein [Dongiaceae bacterium]